LLSFESLRNISHEIDVIDGGMMCKTWELIGWILDFHSELLFYFYFFFGHPFETQAFTLIDVLSTMERWTDYEAVLSIVSDFEFESP
jgi:hypothetical protein